jgi:hypothetical protein
MRYVQSHRIVKVSDERVVFTLAGSGHPRYGDGFGEFAHFEFPSATCVDHLGTVYIADTGNHRVRAVEANGVVRTLAGSGRIGDKDGTGIDCEFNRPTGITVGPGFLLFSDQSNHKIKRVSLVHRQPIVIPEAEPDTDVDSVNSLEDWYKVYQADNMSFES